MSDTADPMGPPLDREAREVLLAVAREAIRTALTTERPELPSQPAEQAVLAEPGAAFVTLRRNGRLRGCIGSMEPRRPLIDDVAQNAVAAASRDPRLPSVTAEELPDLEIKVSVLTPLESLHVADRDELRDTLRPGVDGLVITAGGNRGTFLPSVWEQLPEPDDFLDQLWAKAGLKRRSWPEGLVVERYGTVEFG